jgi:hypothetical protein
MLNDSFDVSARPVQEDEVESSCGSTASLRKSIQQKGKQSSDYNRVEEIFQRLDETCTTIEARRSLLIFRNMYAIKTKMPELKCDIPPTPRIEEDVKEEALSLSVGSAGIGAGARKMSFMERLRGRKSSGKSILTLRD